jgi:hypothetical protein
MGTRRWWPVIAGAVLAVVAAPSGPPSATVHAGPADASDDRLLTLPVDVRPIPVPDGDLSATDRTAEPGPVPPEAAITNADAWHRVGITGDGVKIGVIDFFDVTRFWRVDEHGPKPVAGTTAICFFRGGDCTPTQFDGYDDGGDDHGVAVVEIVKDMAPDAEILIGTAYDIGDYRLLVDWFASNGVQIITRSLGSRYDGPGDGRGPLDDVAAYANSLGITWVNSGGNNGVGRYYRHPVRLIGDRVAFGTSDDTLFGFNGCVSLGGVRWANDWDVAPESRTDYDVFLWNLSAQATGSSPAAGDRIVARSEADQRAGAVPLELLPGVHCPATSTSRLALEIRWRGGDPTGDVLEILDYGQGFVAHTQAAYSAATPIADSALPGVLAVGAVDPPGGDLIGIYSSQGPTNDGRVAPDVSAPAGFASNTFGTRFSGTSAAAPVVAGGAALLLDAELAEGAAALGHLVRHLTVDHGAPGTDPAFGHGEFRLPAPPTGITADPSVFASPLTPTRVLDTRPESAVGPPASTGTVQHGDVVDLPLASIVPPDATAAVVNVTMVGADRASFVQALPTAAAPLGASSTLNVDAVGQTRANLAIVPLSRSGSISLYATGGGHLVVDLVGWFRAASAPTSAGRFTPIAPERVVDTRAGAGVPAASGASLPVPTPTSIPAGAAGALVVTVTGTASTGPGWLQAHPAGADGSIGATSTVNLTAGDTVANTAIVPLADTGAAVRAFVADGGSTHVVVDVIGYMTSDAVPPDDDGRFVPLRPQRAYDSRAGAPLPAGEATRLDARRAGVPERASGIVWNIAHVDVAQPGFGRVWAADRTQPATSSFNFSRAGEVRATAVVAAATEARSLLALEARSAGAPIGHVVADVLGYFT